jgi:hypothetical protein
MDKATAGKRGRKARGAEDEDEDGGGGHSHSVSPVPQEYNPAAYGGGGPQLYGGPAGTGGYYPGSQQQQLAAHLQANYGEQEQEKPSSNKRRKQ